MSTVWYENIEQSTLHEVQAKSPLEKRLRREQREIYEDGDNEPTFEPAYRRMSDAEVKKSQANPESVPGYPGLFAAKREARLAEEARKAARDDAMDAIIVGKAGAASVSEADIQARIESAVAAALEAATTPKGK
jgi:hypothetical protein